VVSAVEEEDYKHLMPRGSNFVVQSRNLSEHSAYRGINKPINGKDLLTFVGAMYTQRMVRPSSLDVVNIRIMASSKRTVFPLPVGA